MKTRDAKSEKALRALRLYLIRRFIMAMIVIYVSSQLINMAYTNIFRRILLDVLQAGELGNNGETFMSLMQLLITTIWGLFSRNMPNKMQLSGNRFLTEAFGNRIQAPEFVSKYGEGMVRIYFMTILILIIVQLVLTIMPYVVMGWWYIKGISEQVRELRRLDHERVKQEEKNRNLLFSDIVHDIKTPITTIVGYSRAMNDGVIRDEEKKQEYLNSIYAKSMRISELITMLFEFVKLDSAGFTLHQEKLDLAELLRENVIALFPDFEDKGLEMDFDIPEDICMVSADRVQMSRVITNLLTNAIRYSSSGCNVFISMNEMPEEPRRYLISVADSGLAISREFAEHIFEPFSRSDEARQTTSGGSGLGLSIAHKVAQMHGGDLILNLDYGEGYTKAFQIIVPALDETEKSQ